jgi:hypothetical protein
MKKSSRDIFVLASNPITSIFPHRNFSLHHSSIALHPASCHAICNRMKSQLALTYIQSRPNGHLVSTITCLMWWLLVWLDISFWYKSLVLKIRKTASDGQSNKQTCTDSQIGQTDRQTDRQTDTETITRTHLNRNTLSYPSHNPTLPTPTHNWYLITISQ